jgi:hypothetical protein
VETGPANLKSLQLVETGRLSGLLSQDPKNLTKQPGSDPRLPSFQPVETSRILSYVHCHVNFFFKNQGPDPGELPHNNRNGVPWKMQLS